jgi:hypothetical protein
MLGYRLAEKKLEWKHCDGERIAREILYTLPPQSQGLENRVGKDIQYFFINTIDKFNGSRLCLGLSCFLTS